MADQYKESADLMSLPLEIRHLIFQQAADAKSRPKKLLRYWFEKKEIKELIAQIAATNPNGPAPRVLPSHDDDEEEKDEDEDDLLDIDSDIADDEDDSEDDVEIEEVEDSDQENDDEEEAEDMDQETGDVDEDEEENNAYEDEHENVDHENDQGDAATVVTQPSPPAPVIKAHGKWRHIPKFMRITHCPPPVELLLASKQLNQEAKNWYYDVAVLQVEATGSFAHTSFFEEAFSQMTKAAYSPMENLRKAEVTFVWDTTWIRADKTGCVEAIFPALLRQRANFVFQILLQAPDLKELVIHWHDSAQDDESVSLRLDVLEPFFNLPARVQMNEHYIAADAKPRKTSVAGKRRIEFQNIIDMGLEQLF